MPQQTYEFNITLPKGKGSIKDTASGENEHAARCVIEARYPGSNIGLGKKIG